MANDNQRDRLDLALRAMSDASIENSEEVIIKIITSLEEEFGDNQKTIAEELQKISRQIEQTGKADVAMDFKQRTTSAMLRLNMERRRGLRPPAIIPVAPATGGSATGGSVSGGTLPGSSASGNMMSRSSASAGSGSAAGGSSSGASREPSSYSSPSSSSSNYSGASSTSSTASPGSAASALGRSSVSVASSVRVDGTQVEYLVHPSRDVRADARAFCDVLKGQKIWESAGGNICAIKFSAGPQVIIVEEIAFTCSVVLSVSNFEKAADDLDAQGFQIVGSVATPSGSASVFASDCGSKFALIARK